MRGTAITNKLFFIQIYMDVKVKNKTKVIIMISAFLEIRTYKHLYNVYGHNHNVKQNLEIRVATYFLNMC